MLGKLAERIALVLMGKHKPIFDPSGTRFILSYRVKLHSLCLVDCGDYVVVSNARSVKVTGRKADQLVYRHHTMFPGGLKEIKYKEMMSRKPDEASTTTLSACQYLDDTLLDHSTSCFWHAPEK